MIKREFGNFKALENLNGVDIKLVNVMRTGYFNEYP